MLIIGSTAARHLLPDWRKPQDTDLIGNFNEIAAWEKQHMEYVEERTYEGDKKIIYKLRVPIITASDGTKFGGGVHFVEWEIAKDGNTASILNDLYGTDVDDYGWVRGNPLFVSNWRAAYAPPEVLLMLKLSHRYLKDSPHFWKTMKDVRMLRESGAELTPSLLEILKDREAETYTYAHPNLDRSKEDFFADDAITYIYDHDSLHEAVAVEDAPAYLQYLKPGAAVAVDMNVFDSLPLSTRINGVVEEAAVLTLERSLVPFWLEQGNVEGARNAEVEVFRKALMKVCSSITSGRFREFAWEHANEAMARYIMRFMGEETIVDRFQAGITDGTVIRLEE